MTRCKSKAEIGQPFRVLRLVVAAPRLSSCSAQTGPGGPAKDSRQCEGSVRASLNTNSCPEESDGFNVQEVAPQMTLERPGLSAGLSVKREPGHCRSSAK